MRRTTPPTTWTGSSTVWTASLQHAELGREVSFSITLLGRRRIWSTFLVAGLLIGAIFAQGAVLSLLILMPKIPGLSDGLGWTATKSAWVGAPNSVLLIAVSAATGVLARRVDTRALLAIGGTPVTIAIGLISQFHSTVAQLMSIGVISGIGLGMVVALVPIMVIESVRPEEQALVALIPKAKTLDEIPVGQSA
ncbi:MFS transporter [Streptomyces sp. NPDC090075]|uniref:MFS transporter n=1 Tax=Streptomyces sp. NPDC090075 TaxID=3365937 RepID=UPI00380315F5